MKCLLNLKKSKQCLATPLVFPFSIIWKCSSESIFPGFMVWSFSIHHELDQDAVYCFVCYKVVKEGKIRLTGMTEASFLVKGFINWKDATRGLSKHEILTSIKQQLLPCLPKLMLLTLCYVNFLKIRVGGGGGGGGVWLGVAVPPIMSWLRLCHMQVVATPSSTVHNTKYLDPY